MDCMQHRLWRERIHWDTCSEKCHSGSSDPSENDKEYSNIRISCMGVGQHRRFHSCHQGQSHRCRGDSNHLRITRLDHLRLRILEKSQLDIVQSGPWKTLAFFLKSLKGFANHFKDSYVFIKLRSPHGWMLGLKLSQWWRIGWPCYNCWVRLPLSTRGLNLAPSSAHNDPRSQNLRQPSHRWGLSCRCGLK